MKRQLDSIFNPGVIACIGASNREGSVGFALLHNLLEGSFEGSFEGRVYPVNPKHETIQGVAAYKKIADLPEKADLAVIATPAHTVPGVVEECGKAGVGGLLIISAGFSEAGEAGRQMLAQITAACQQYSMRLVGPNCLGFINTAGVLMPVLPLRWLSGAILLLSLRAERCVLPFSTGHGIRTWVSVISSLSAQWWMWGLRS